MVKLKNLSVRFGRVSAVADLSLDLPERGLVALIGPNAAGKSTLLDVLSGFLRPSSGCVVMTDVARPLPPRRLRRLSARLHQVLVFPSGVEVADFLSLASRPHKGRWLLGSRRSTTDSIEAPDEVSKALEAVGLNLESRDYLERISWGQARLVALAATVLAPKKILLLDEPFAGLAPRASQAACRMVSSEASRRLVLVAEHDLDTVLPLAHCVLVMVAGRVTARFRAGEARTEELLPYFVTANRATVL